MSVLIAIMFHAKSKKRVKFFVLNDNNKFLFGITFSFVSNLWFRWDESLGSLANI